MARPVPFLLACFLALALAPAALAAAPANDGPAGAAAFEVYGAANGTPSERQAVAELVDAGPDAGVPRCLGGRSFARTVWYRLPATPTAREITVEGTGRTTGALDLAAFVQRPGAPASARPNACAGQGAGGSDAAEDRTPALGLRVPAHHDVLIQVGRRGARESADDERAFLALVEDTLPADPRPAGDRAGRLTPSLGRDLRARVALGGATTSEEDPATPACPSLGGVWRKVRAPAGGGWTVTASGGEVGALAVFAGARPDVRRLAGCIDRDGAGPLVLPIRARARQTLWIRAGTDRPAGTSRATVRLTRFRRGDELSGGGCLAGLRRPRVGGTLRGLTFVPRVANGPVCAARLRLVGPRGRIYARGDVAVLRGRGQVVRLRRVRRLARGAYRLRVDAAGVGGLRVPVRSTVSTRLR